MTQTNTDVIVRELVADTIDVRESAEGRRVCGIAAPFGSRFDAGEFVEVQGTAEERPFSRGQLDELLGLAEKGIGELFSFQKSAIG